MAQLIQTIMMSALCVGNVSKPVLPSAPGSFDGLSGIQYIFNGRTVEKVTRKVPQIKNLPEACFVQPH